jgi:hypothetical protein
MSYEPRLIIRKNQLEKHRETFEQEQWDKDEEIAKVAKFLLEVNNYETIKFDDIELVLCKPELTYFNDAVRGKLNDLEIDYRTEW